jgi:DNA gyrase subunit A
MKFRDGDSLLSMSVIRATQVAAEEAAGLSEETEDSAGVEATPAQIGEVKPQYVFTITDGGFAKRTRINEYRLQSRGGLGIKAMSLTNEERGGLVGAFIVEDGDEVLSITQNGQVVRSPINEEFRPTGRSTMGVKFVTPKSGDAVAVVARSVEAKVDEEVAEAAEAAADDVTEAVATDPAVEAAAVETADLEQDVEESVDDGTDATIGSGDDPTDDLTGDPTDDATDDRE